MQGDPNHLPFNLNPPPPPPPSSDLHAAADALNPALDGSLGRSAGRRVQWPADQDLTAHVSIEMTGPPSASKSKIDEHGLVVPIAAVTSYDSDATFPPPTKRRPLKQLALAALAKAKEEAAAAKDDRPGDGPEQRATVADLDVFVDPGERDGLPNFRPPSDKPEEASSGAAWGLVRNFTRRGPGDFSAARTRRGFHAVPEDEPSPGDKAKAKETGPTSLEVPAPDSGVFQRPRGRSFIQVVKDAVEAARQDEDFVPPVPRQETLGLGVGGGGGGILSALIALQRQQAEASNGSRSPGGSASTSVANTPSQSRAPSRRNSLDGDSSDDEEVEKALWLKKQRAKSKNPFREALKIGGHSHSRTLSSPLTKDPTTTLPTDQQLKLSPPASEPRPPPSTTVPHLGARPRSFFGDTMHQVKKFGSHVGMELEDAGSRPEAARSGAGVFGGLVLATGNLTGIATPSGSTLGPMPSRSGFHVSRYQPDTTPATDDRADRGSSHRRGRSSPGARSHSAEPSDSSLPADISHPSTPGSAPTDSPVGTPGGLKPKEPTFKINLSDLTPHTSRNSPLNTDSSRKEHDHFSDYFGLHHGHKEKETQEEREHREWEKEKKRRKKAKDKRKREEVFITLHVAAILSRQDFIMKLGRTFMMFGAPSHRLEAQIQATARVLEISAQVVYIPGVMILSFGDAATHTSEIKFMKQANGLDLGKLLAAYLVYYKVIHDQISVTEASVELDNLMVAKPKYKLWQQCVIGGLASAFIQPSAFYGSFVDMLVSVPLGAFLVFIQVVVSKNDLYASLFEIVIVAFFSFIAAALASTGVFCFAAVASGSIVLILPGYIVLCGSLELANRSIISGSVRLVYAILYSLFLGFGLSIGSEVYQRATGLTVSSDYTCSSLRVDAPWWRSKIGQEWFILTIPCYLLLLSLRNGQPMWRKETPTMIIIGSVGYLCNFYGTSRGGKAFADRSDISSALGSLAVGILGNIWGKFTKGSPFVVMVAGVLLQLPSGLSNGGLLQFTNTSANSTSVTYAAGFTTAESLIEVAIGLTVGLFVAAAIVNFTFGGGRRRGSNLSSF